MARVRLAWVLTAALAAAGSLAAHELAYRLAAPEIAGAEGPHGYLSAAPAFLVACLALSLVALGGSVLAGAEGLAAKAPPARLFALLPPAGFVLQEHLERLLHDGAFPLLAILEPTFLVGLLLQLPFAVAALALARALAGLAETVGRRLRATSPRPRPAARLSPPPAPPDRPRLRVLASGWAQRGPPVPITGS